MQSTPSHCWFVKQTKSSGALEAICCKTVHMLLGSTVVERVGVLVVESDGSWDVGEEEDGMERGVDGEVEGAVVEG